MQRIMRVEKEMSIHTSILAEISPWTEEHGRLHPIGLQRLVLK